MNSILTSPEISSPAHHRRLPFPLVRRPARAPVRTLTSDSSPRLTHGELLAHLRARGLRLTPSRSAMLAALRRFSAPVTLSQLQQALLPQRVALATLFRSMLRMEEVELVTRTIDLRGTTNWELNVGRTHNFYVTDRASGEIAPLDPEIAQTLHDLLSSIQKRLLARGYRQLQLNVAFSGSVPHAGRGTSQAPELPSHAA